MKSVLEDDDATPHNERELTLNTGTILGIFMALVLLCGAFFGLGYKIGSHKPAQQELGTVADSASEPTSNFTDFKPAAGSPESSNEPPPRHTVEERKEAQATEAYEKPTEPTPEPHAAARVRAEATTHASVATPAPSMAAAPPAGTYFVQVAAVSHEEDAQLLIRALKAKGYPVGAHTQPQDKFYHVQVGPFASRKDADAAKQQLLTDGYQPIIK